MNFIRKIAVISTATLMALSGPALSAQNGTASGNSENKIAIASHRGFWNCDAAQHAQNTIASLRLAQENKFWGSEFDVHLTSDDVIIVNHDDDIQGTPIWTNTYAVLHEKTLKNGEHPSTLDEYLTQAEKSATTVLVLEIKIQKNTERENLLTDKCLQALKDHNMYDPSRVIFISFSLNACRRVAEKAPGFSVQYLRGDKTPEELHNYGITGIDYELHTLLKHPEYVSQAHSLGMAVNSWTVNKASDIRKMIDLNVDCITTNEPLLVRSMLGNREKRIPETDTGNPKANSKAEVTMGNARFTVLTSRLVRMEWAADGKFEDRATLGVVNRNLPVPKFTVSRFGKHLTIKTGKITLKYNDNGTGKFDAGNLSITFNMPDKNSRKGLKKVTWHPGADASGNLLGTTRTLDRCDGEHTVDPFDPGVASKDGWAVIDESTRQVFVPVKTDWKNWVADRNNVDRQDLYMFAYGHDYKDAISDFTKISGKIPLPPKFALGYWWCRYWQYSDFEFINLAKEIRSMSIPIDVMVLDMDWHETWSCFTSHRKKDSAGQREGWTGYTWNKSLFPDPANCLKDLHNLGLKTTLNLHPASGIQPYEEPYERFVKDYLSRTNDYDGPKNYIDKNGNKVYVPFRIDDENWADAYFNSVIHPFEAEGVDFWWLDWQQWKTSRYTPGLSNTFWLNYTFFNDMERQSAKDGIYARRPMIYHRWGGIGSHRYQIGFSGDTFATWKVLGYLPYFTSTASNIGYGYWGHDIGGHMQPKGVHTTNPELYTRWLQYGVFTPIFKTHSTKNMTMEKRFWMFPDYFDDMRAAIRLRYTLSPYIYNAARETYDTGISMCRPMYYDYPEKDNSYSYKQQYMFGDDILATVICNPVDTVSGLASRSIWFPAGNDWYDAATGKMYKGGQTDTLEYTIDENPYYIKAGAIIPMASDKITSLQEKSDELYLFIAPGDGKDSTSVYEDDGVSQAYKSEYATTEVSKVSDPESATITVMPRKGTYVGIDPQRRIRIVIAGVFAPEKVTVNGKEIAYDRFAAHNAQNGLSNAVWGYNGYDMYATVYIPAENASEQITVKCEYGKYAAAHASLIYGKKGLIRRMMALTPEAKLQMKLKSLPLGFQNLAQCGSYVTEDPMNAGKYLEAIDKNAAETAFDNIGVQQDFISKIKAQLNL
ncbi:MAG: DUF5110 domain-containing protein [Bacteroidales bacterium]|nr:DUF5110 domain-containing protein [Bacteroidales bacterium]MCI1785458.1 DUF5110 domain-containing protein [Bacteroidales bacterium]